MTLADVAIGCHVGFISSRRPEFFSQEKYPGLSRLWKTLEGRESFKRTVPPPA
jgi:glutathione S-transferase